MGFGGFQGFGELLKDFCFWKILRIKCSCPHSVWTN
jgi:hypothetical protein